MKKLFIGLVILLLLGIVCATASGGSSLNWQGFAGQANHACYHDHGVQQLFGPTGGGAGAPQEVDVVCRDGWVVNIPGGINGW